MAKKVRCFTYALRNNGVNVKGCYLKDIIQNIFEISNTLDTKELINGNRVIIYKEEDDQNYLSIELVKKVEKEIDNFTESKLIDEKYILIRIGREKDIEGAMKRNLNTWEGEEIIEPNEQESYNLEICTYILIDIENSIIMELYGRYAPTVKSLTHVLNNLILKSKDKNLEGITFQYKNIMTEELIDALRDDGIRLGKIEYAYEAPNLSFLNTLGLTTEQISVINELGVYEIEVTMKGKGRAPLTRTSDKIKLLISSLSKSPQKIKDKISFIGSTNSTSSKSYTFKEEEVTYNIDIPYNKNTDDGTVKLSLDEIAYEAYIRMSLLHEKNIAKILSYISK